MNRRRLQGLPRLAVPLLAALQAALGSILPVAAAPGDTVVDLSVPEQSMGAAGQIAKAIGFDGHNLFYAEYAGSILHRVDVPPRGSSMATGHIDIPVVGLAGGIMAISYDGGRDLFWAVSGDGTGIYLLNKTSGMATRQFTIDPTNLPGLCKTQGCQAEAKINYDRSDGTIWYAPDVTRRVYHFQSTPDLLGRGVLVTSSPYFDVDVAPNDMNAYCGWSGVEGLATGGADLFFTIGGCHYYFEYSKTGTRVAAIPRQSTSSGDFECDNISYSVSVIWAREGWTGHIYALEQPSANACVYGG
jgi:hypothetical protein